MKSFSAAAVRGENRAEHAVHRHENDPKRRLAQAYRVTQMAATHYEAPSLTVMLVATARSGGAFFRRAESDFRSEWPRRRLRG